MDSATQTFQHRALPIKLWPPSQSTRLMLVDRMIKNFTNPSIFSRKYDLLSKEEAEEDAKGIEETMLYFKPPKQSTKTKPPK
jgi:Ran GTPase-activating protein 1